MVISQLIRCLLVLLCVLQLPLVARDILLEFKAAYFLSTNCRFKNIYGRGAALYGPEVTVQLCDNSCWYGFASVDYLKKDGNSIGLKNPTTVKLIPLAFGVKYFVPFCYGNVYFGVGFQPTHVKTTNCSSFVAEHTSSWGMGGIAKVGTYLYTRNNVFVDLFIDYSYARMIRNRSCSTSAPGVIALKANVSGAIFGVGLGYRF